MWLEPGRHDWNEEQGWVDKYKGYTRRQLYDLVWATPMMKLAKEFGLSDVGLRKTCVKHDIPTPPLGYRAKYKFGKPVKRPPLEPPGEGVSDRVLVSVFARAELPDEIAEAAIRARERILAAIVVPTDPSVTLSSAREKAAKAFRDGEIRLAGADT